ncbi:CotH kinase family protein [Pseudopedobacter beijingensis]|uniref:CotH kinase family protein n=1 Tax=Pseudopedobacter beijingensis TaxID=1207056 RepID=A0ABW4ICD8_9SPHI
MKKIIYCCLFFIAALSGCKKDKIKQEVTSEYLGSLELRFEAKNNPNIDKDVICEFNGEEVTAVIPKLNPDKKNLILSFNSKDIGSVTVKGVNQVSGVSANSFVQPVTYHFTFSNGEEKSFTLKVKEYTGLPILHIRTEGKAAIVSKSIYLNGDLSINTNLDFEQEINSLPIEIRGRGNSTWEMPKKPYRIKLKEKTKILGIAAAKKWVLLANYADKTLIRTAIAFDLGKAIHADYTPEYRQVEVFLNETYIGTYTLTEQVEVNPGRVDITELKSKDTEADKITGGYLVELDRREDEDYIVKTTLKGLPFAIKSPEEPNTEQYNYIKDYLIDTEKAIYAENFADPINGYAKYINVESFINWFLVQELMKNQDAQSYSSIFYYKDRNGKLGMGPLWDFDLSMGNVDYSVATQPEGWWIRHGPWFTRLFQDPVFAEKVRKRWKEIRQKEVEAMLKGIDTHARKLKYAQKKNFTIWDILDKKVWPNPEIYYTYEGEVNQIKDWLNIRIKWLDAKL